MPPEVALTVTAPTVSENVPISNVPVPLTVTAPVARALLTPYFNVPAPTVVRPVKVFAPESVQVPVPALVSAPVVVPIMLARLLPVLVPPSVNPKVGPVIVPALVTRMSPLLATMLLALPSVSRPL